MNAPVRKSEVAALGDVDDFIEVCEQQQWFYGEGWIDLQTAVDNLQRLAKRWGLVDAIGQDQIQAVMADAFVPLPDLDQYDRAEIARRIERWEAHDISRPPAPKPESRRGVSQSTIDAFNHVAAIGDPAKLARWLRDHSDVAGELLDEVA